VKARRGVLGLSAEALWERTEIERGNSNYISQLENGRRTQLPDFDIIFGLAQGLGVSVTDVLRGAGVLPVDLEEASTEAPGSHTIHAMVNAIDWVKRPERREVAESLLRTFLEQDQRGISRPQSSGAAATHGQR